MPLGLDLKLDWSYLYIARMYRRLQGDAESLPYFAQVVNSPPRPTTP